MLSNDELAAYAGTYYSAELDVTYELTVDERGLVLQMSNALPTRASYPSATTSSAAAGCCASGAAPTAPSNRLRSTPAG